MKKYLVAIAALAAAAGAFAQSSLTISGQLDAGLSSVKLSTGGKITKESGGYHGASRLRFTGSEDMGGGTRANFLLEMQPGVDNGLTSANGLFNRGAWLGLSGGWGETRLGRVSTVAMGTICGADLIGCYSGFNGGGILFSGTNATGRWISGNPSRGGAGLNASTGVVGTSAVGTGTAATTTNVTNQTGPDVTRVLNSINYITPNMGGFTGQLQYAVSGYNSLTPTRFGNGNELGLSGNYANGPLSLGLAFQSANKDVIDASGKQTTLGAAYDFGAFKVGAAFQKESASGAAAKFTSARGVALTAVMPIGAALPYIKLGNHKVTRGAATGAGAGGSFGIADGTDSQIFNIGTQYSLSKRTKLYADYATDGKGNSAIGTNIAKPTTVSAGIQHTF